MQQEQSLAFDRYRMDLPNEQVWNGQQLIPLTSKAFTVLRHLVEHTGQLVTKAELFEVLWPDIAVSDGALTFCIVEIRKALGDNAKAPRFIETVHRRGYRFLPTATTTPLRGARVRGQGSVKELQNEVECVPDHAVSALHPGPRTPSPVLVGRETELVHLHRWLDKSLAGERHIVFVTGEPGIGKTTLTEAFLLGARSREAFGVQEQEESQNAKVKSQKSKVGASSLAPSPQPLAPRMWLGRGQCIEQYGPGEPYMPILEALGRLCREPEGELLIPMLRQHAPTWLVQMPTLLPAAEFEALQRQTQGVTRERMLREMGEAIDAITTERPLILWLEDLHWSDASTLELLALLARRREPARLLVIGTYRPVDVIMQEHPLRAVKQELQLHGLCAELPLGLLSETQVAEYLMTRFQVSSPTATGEPILSLAEGGQGKGLSSTALQELAPLIHRRTDGNPLFMVTAVEDLIEQHVITQSDGQWKLRDDLAAIETRVPDSLQQMIERQVERLSPEDRRILEVASVAGMEFSAATVAAGVETDAEAVEERCEELARRGQFLRTQGSADWPDGTVAARYSFLHVLYQEVLYDRIPTGRRQRLHQRIGEREEHAYGERAREIAAALAAHFEQGRDYRKSVQYLQQAGENAIRRSAHQEAIAHLTKGLALLKLLADTPERGQQELGLQYYLIKALIVTGRTTAPEVERISTRVEELCHQVGETPYLFWVRIYAQQD